MQYQPKSKLVTFLLCGFLGAFGIHRFYTGKVWTGILWLFTGGLCGVGVVVDMLMILFNSFRDKRGMLLNNDLPTIAIIAVFIVWLILCFVFNIFGFVAGVIGNIIGLIF